MFPSGLHELDTSLDFFFLKKKKLTQQSRLDIVEFQVSFQIHIILQEYHSCIHTPSVRH